MGFSPSRYREAETSRADFSDLSGCESRDCRDDRRKERPQIFDTRANSHDHDGRDSDLSKILLISQIAVRRNDDRESRCDGCAEKDTVTQSQPILLPDGGRLGKRQLVG